MNVISLFVYSCGIEFLLSILPKKARKKLHGRQLHCFGGKPVRHMKLCHHDVSPYNNCQWMSHIPVCIVMWHYNSVIYFTEKSKEKLPGGKLYSVGGEPPTTHEAMPPGCFTIKRPQQNTGDEGQACVQRTVTVRPLWHQHHPDGHTCKKCT